MARGAGEQRAPYFVVQRLVGTLDHYWTRFNGWAVAQGVSPLELHFDELLDLTYYWLIKDAGEEEEVEKFNSRLWMPPKKAKVTAADSPWSDAATKASLAAFAEGMAG